MDLTSIANLLYILTCLAPFCLGGLGFLAFGALLVWIIYRQWQPKSAASLAAERRALHDELERLTLTAGLRPWSADALTDLSTDWNATWLQFGRDLSARGTIPSLSEPKGPPWVIFALKIRGARRPDGQLAARTTAQTFDYHIAAGDVAIEVDGVPLGRVQPDGTLLDPDGQPIGRAPRPGGSPIKFRLGTVTHLHDRRQRTYPVTLRGRVVGHLGHPRARMTNVIPLKKRQFPPAVTPEGLLSKEEVTWLLALAILQVAGYNVLETVWTNLA